MSAGDSARRLLRFWFTFERSVSPREYLLSGLALGVVKYAGDALFIWMATGRPWQITDYLSPLSSSGSLVKFRDASPAELLLLSLWSLPFLWIGISMSIRRSLDADWGPWIALLFFVPYVNYLFMAAMCLLPTRAPSDPPEAQPRAYEARLPGALLAIAAGASIGLAMVAVSVSVLSRYGLALFFGTPFVIGLVTAYLFNRRYAASARESQQVMLMTLAIIGGVLLLAAMEGALCLAMAAPLAIAVGAMGAAIGRRLAIRRDVRGSGAWIAVAILPLSAGIESRAPSPLREVSSSVIIDAPPATVWRNVIAFPSLPKPSELVFRAGIAYPLQARIVGEGVGAIRYCEFSTGAFVEPITHWEPGVRLSFDVTSQPRALNEWSQYEGVTPPHVDGYMRSRRGEFRLVALPDGRTRLEGSTWYEMSIQPSWYWVLYGDLMIGKIHRRVLEHIRVQAEM